ncbi:serine/threonine-protein kinase [Actinoplanes sp. NPDC049668]|uniref:serine/threonine-protein kinase n=1 Tax=unclassified Actinoplanes TaxID=2626549 RepID=UPI0033B65A93
MDATPVLGGRYVLRDQLGAGGMAVVWRAQDQVLGREVAVKLLAARHAGDPDSRRRIHAEARAAAALSHPNIAQVYDYGESEAYFGRVPYVVMELVRGGTLQERMTAGELPPRFAMRVAAEVAAALAAAHADGLVHRDIKPANVMVPPAGVKVVDFGIAAAIDPGGTGDPDFEVLGTPAYLAPERLIDDAVEPASDVYALGVLLYRMLSGHSPWSVDTTTQMLTAHIYIDPEPLTPQPGVPGYIIALCNRCLVKDPTERPSAREAAALLAQGAGLRVVDDIPPQPQAGPWQEDDDPSVLIRPKAEPSAPAVTASPTETAPPAETTSADGAEVRKPVHRRRGVLPFAFVLLAAVAAGLWWLVAGDDRPAPGSSAGAPAASRSASAAAAPSATSGGKAPATPGTATPGAARPGTVAPGTVVQNPANGVPPPTTTAPVTATTGATPTPDAEPTPAPPQERTLTSAGGSVRAVCPEAGTAQLLSWTAAKPYKVDEVEAGPASAAVAVFRHGNRQVRMTVTCSGGVPSHTTG